MSYKKQSATERFVKKVLVYHRTHGRHRLPWRVTRNSYRILVSEVMLQQTQVARVMPFYCAFLKKFPTALALALAPLSEVLRVWNGLGYNRRAKFLHEAAKAIAGRHGGIVPRSYLELRALPGVGDYTAKAVRTFAFDEPEVMLETNIRAAVIHEFFPRGRSVRDEKLEVLLKDALQYVDSVREWYAALMDYGSHIKSTHGNATRRSRTYTKQPKFEGSLRQIRGALLREHTRGGTIDMHTFSSKNGFSAEKAQQAYQALVYEGLL